MSRPEPPRVARWLLELALPDDRRDDAVGDLGEVYERLHRERGALRARAWYLRQSLAFALRFTMHGLMERRRSFLADPGRDVVMALRGVRKRPGFAVVVVLTLALGLGANAAMFQVVEALRLRSLPVAEPERLTIVEVADMSRWQGRRTSGYPVLSHALWERIRDGGGPFDATLAWASTSFAVDESGASTVVRGLYASGGFFDALGVAPALGRTFGPADDRLGCSLGGAVLGHGYWQRAFGGDRSIVGRTISLDGHPVPVMGVAQPGFTGVEVGRAFDVAVPICTQEVFGDREQWIDDATVWWLTVMGRTPPGRSLEAVNAELETRSPALFRATLPDGYAEDGVDGYLGLTLRAVPGSAGVSSLRSRYGDSFLALLAVTGLVLLLVCANLANLSLARGAARERELAVRRALGASRWRLLRELSVESVVLAAAGAGAALLLAGALSRRLAGFLGAEVSLDLSIGGSTIAFVLVAAGVSCAVFGLLPAWRASRASADGGMDAMRDGRGTAAASRGSGMRRGLVVSQVALSMVLLSGALLFTGTLRSLLAVDTGFDADGVSVVHADFRTLDLSTDERSTFKRDLLEGLQSIPGVSAVAEVRHVPMGGTGSSSAARRPGAAGEAVPVRLNGVTADYLYALGIPLLSGRSFEAGDPPEAASAIVTATFAERAGLGPDPVGQTVDLEWPAGTVEVVGLVPDTKYFDLREDPVPTAFLPKDMLPDSRSYTDFMVRASLPATALRGALQEAAATVSAQVSIEVRAFDETIRAGLVRERLLSTVAGFFGILAVLVAAIGLYGVMSHHVAHRTSDIGVRIALGASRRDILSMVLLQAGALSAAGLLLGSVLSLGATAAVESFLFGVESPVWTLVLAAGVMLATAAVACSLPARRAAGLDPQVALREE